MPRAKQGYAEHLPLKRQLRSRMTGAEIRLWSWLRGKQLGSVKFRRQHGIGPYIVDFYCPERAVVIEVDGDNHAEPRQIMKDHERDAYLQSLGLRVIRYTNDDILSNVDGVLECLIGELRR
jgi:very-short-patch-repair endonuclease